MGTIVAMERNTIRRCEAVKWENDPEYGAIAVPCGEHATAWVVTPYSAAKRIADLSGSRIARFIQRRAACDRHAAMAAATLAAAR
jgi:hypothetical protein